MLIVLIITFLGTVLLSMIVPGRIALPFKKINDAVRELQDCNFDVSIYYKMITSMKHFEELREDRISVEQKKFDTLANLTKRNVLVANAKGQLIYLNNQVYTALNLQSEDVLKKDMEDTIIPKSIKDAFDLALKRRSKIENAEVHLTHKVKEERVNEETGETEEVEIEEELFKGYANVIPIRAKESDLDYYLMVLSEEIFA